MSKFNEGLQGKAFEALKQMKALGIVISIIMILLGICMFIQPIATSAVMIWILVVGTLVNGISKIVGYCRMPKGARDGFLLASGILLIVASIILIGSGCNYHFEVTAGIEVCIAFMIGFTCIFTGIGRICGSGMVQQAGGSKGLAIFAGILDILCGCILLSSPLFGLLALTVVFGLYMVITGIALLVRFISL